MAPKEARSFGAKARLESRHAAASGTGTLKHERLPAASPSLGKCPVSALAFSQPPVLVPR
jgi:hypothetical protein